MWHLVKQGSTPLWSPSFIMSCVLLGLQAICRACLSKLGRACPLASSSGTARSDPQQVRSKCSGDWGLSKSQHSVNVCSGMRRGDSGEMVRLSQRDIGLSLTEEMPLTVCIIPAFLCSE